MKNKVYNLISSILQMFIVIALFIPNFTYYSFSGNSQQAVNSFKLFGDYSLLTNSFAHLKNQTFYKIFPIIVSILILILSLIAIAHLVFVILELCNKNVKHLNKIKKILSISSIVVSSLIIILAFVTTYANVLATSYYKCMLFGTGIHFAFFTLSGAILGLICTKYKFQ